MLSTNSHGRVGIWLANDVAVVRVFPELGTAWMVPLAASRFSGGVISPDPLLGFSPLSALAPPSAPAPVGSQQCPCSPAYGCEQRGHWRSWRSAIHSCSKSVPKTWSIRRWRARSDRLKLWPCRRQERTGHVRCPTEPRRCMHRHDWREHGGKDVGERGGEQLDPGSSAARGGAEEQSIRCVPSSVTLARRRQTPFFFFFFLAERGVCEQPANPAKYAPVHTERVCMHARVCVCACERKSTYLSVCLCFSSGWPLCKWRKDGCAT